MIVIHQINRFPLFAKLLLDVTLFYFFQPAIHLYVLKCETYNKKHQLKTIKTVFSIKYQFWLWKKRLD